MQRRQLRVRDLDAGERDVAVVGGGQRVGDDVAHVWAAVGAGVERAFLGQRQVRLLRERDLFVGGVGDRVVVGVGAVDRRGVLDAAVVDLSLGDRARSGAGELVSRGQVGGLLAAQRRQL